MANHVNLDALIPRDDFDSTQSQKMATKTQTLKLSDLKSPTFFIDNLRKPDFQRETNEWDAKRIAEFIDTFLEGDSIPAIILWQSAAHYFVIDGCHRLSSLVAWINDDYGDGALSRAFYEAGSWMHKLPLRNVRGQWSRSWWARIGIMEQVATLPSPVDPRVVERARKLGVLAIQIQWVEGSSASAEASFLKINQKAASINATEMAVLQARRRPLGIAARAIVRSGKGHKYWSKFTPATQVKLESLAAEYIPCSFNRDFRGERSRPLICRWPVRRTQPKACRSFLSSLSLSTTQILRTTMSTA